MIASEDNLPLTQSIINQEATAGPFLALSGTAASVVKDLGITLKKEHPNWIEHNQVFTLSKVVRPICSRLWR